MAERMCNLIKSGGNGDIDEYSTTETKTNKVWIDGKPIYRKVVNFGALPNNTTKSVAHNISNMETVVFANLIGYDNLSRGGNCIVMPYIGSDFAHSAGFYLNGTNVYCRSGASLSSSYPNSYATIEYTKTTD